MIVNKLEEIDCSGFDSPLREQFEKSHLISHLPMNKYPKLRWLSDGKYMEDFTRAAWHGYHACAVEANLRLKDEKQ